MTTTTTTSTTERSRLIAIRAAWLFDGVSDGLTPNPTVVLDGTTIVAVHGPDEVPDGADVIDLAGATLLPGLVDGHVHTVFDASADPVARATRLRGTPRTRVGARHDALRRAFPATWEQIPDRRACRRAIR